MPQEMQKLSIELPAYTVTQLKFWGDKFGITGSEAINYFVRLGMNTYDQADTINYLSYKARQTARARKEGS